LPRNDQIVRILSVARALAASRRGVSLKALADREGWHWRTVYRDKDALQAAGFPIREPSPGRYKLDDGWGVPNLPGVEPDEIAAFFAIRALAESWRTTALGKPLDRLWMKLASARGGQGTLVPSREAWFTVRSPLAIDYRAHAKVIDTLERAVREHAVVSCRYTALSTGATTSREIEPGELYWDPGLESLYVIGWCRLRGAVRVFAVHRFLMATLGDERFAPRGEARSAAALKHAFRVWRGDNVEVVRVRFSRAAAQEIRERTWRPRQRLEEEPGGTVVLALEVSGTAEVARWVMGFGGEAEVLAPAELRRDVEARLQGGAARYAGERALRAAEDDEEELLAWDDKGAG
jgi:predicted DNA-binding transcriptional regulator YafY